MLSARRGLADEPVPQILDCSFRRERDEVRAHNFPNKQDLERIDGVFASEVETAADYFFGKDRALKQKHCSRVREHRSDEERQQNVDVVRELERKEDGCKRRAHCAAQYGCHADEGPESGSFIRKKDGFDAAQSRTHHEQWSEHAAGSSRAERNNPDRGFDKQHPGYDRAGHVALEQRLDRVVSDAESLWKDQAAQSNRKPTDRGPPLPVDGQFLKRVFCCVHADGKKRRETAGKQSCDYASQQPLRSDENGVLRDGEERTQPKNVPPCSTRSSRGEGNGDRAAGLPFK